MNESNTTNEGKEDSAGSVGSFRFLWWRVHGRKRRHPIPEVVELQKSWREFERVCGLRSFIAWLDGKLKWAMKTRGTGEIQPLTAPPPPPPLAAVSASDSSAWRVELQSRIVAVEDEQQTFEDWVDHENWKEADYFLTRMIHEAKKIQLHLKVAPEKFE